MRLSEDAQTLLDKLPDGVTNETWPKYEEFIKLYGTHYASKGKLGCRFQQTVLNGQGKLDLEGQASVQANMNADFQWVMHMHGAATASGGGATKNYLNVTHTSFKCFGGAEACPYNNISFNDYSARCPKHAVMLKPGFAPITDLIQNETKRGFMKTAFKNYFDRQFLKHEVIPLMKVSMKVVTGPIASHDSGGQCGAPGVCPPPYSSQLGKPEYCDGRALGDNYCHGNPVDGPTQAEMDAKIAQVAANKTNLSKRIQVVSDQAAAMLRNNIVKEGHIGWLLAEYTIIMLALQVEMEVETCGWTFDCRTAWENKPCWGWHNEEGPHTHYTSRKFTYVKGLL